MAYVGPRMGMTLPVFAQSVSSTTTEPQDVTLKTMTEDYLRAFCATEFAKTGFNAVFGGKVSSTARMVLIAAGYDNLVALVRDENDEYHDEERSLHIVGVFHGVPYGDGTKPVYKSKTKRFDPGVFDTRGRDFGIKVTQRCKDGNFMPAVQIDEDSSSIIVTYMCASFDKKCGTSLQMPDSIPSAFIYETPLFFISDFEGCDADLTDFESIRSKIHEIKLGKTTYSQTVFLGDVIDHCATDPKKQIELIRNTLKFFHGIILGNRDVNKLRVTCLPHLQFHTPQGLKPTDAAKYEREFQVLQTMRTSSHDKNSMITSITQTDNNFGIDEEQQRMFRTMMTDPALRNALQDYIMNEKTQFVKVYGNIVCAHSGPFFGESFTKIVDTVVEDGHVVVKVQVPTMKPTYPVRYVKYEPQSLSTLKNMMEVYEDLKTEYTTAVRDFLKNPSNQANHALVQQFALMGGPGNQGFANIDGPALGDPRTAMCASQFALLSAEKT